jgi:DNA-binding SARP family transcriptional activator
MYRLKLLGGASMDGPTGPLTGRAVQPRNLALLAVLAVAGCVGCSRDKLIALLWPESDEERGRHHLSQSLYLLRKALGQDAIRNIGDSIALNDDVIATDINEFEDSVARASLHEALQLYGGPFLDGVYVKNAVGFEEWVESERRSLTAAHAQALENLADVAEEENDYAAATRWLERLLAEDPYKSSTVIRLMQALAARGDPANAIQVAREHELRLWTEFEMAVPTEVAELVLDLRRSDTEVRSVFERAIEPSAREDSPAPVRVGEDPRSISHQ